MSGLVNLSLRLPIPGLILPSVPPAPPLHSSSPQPVVIIVPPFNSFFIYIILVSLRWSTVCSHKSEIHSAENHQLLGKYSSFHALRAEHSLVCHACYRDSLALSLSHRMLIICNGMMYGTCSSGAVSTLCFVWKFSHV